MLLAPLIIVSGPSGCGKSTLIRRLLHDQTWPLRLSVSATTRRPRPGEQEGVDYFFVSSADFLRARENALFLEWAEVHGNYYGTLVSEVAPYREQGVGVLLDIDVQGWDKVRQRCPDAASIFIKTSAFETLEQRLRGRVSEAEEAIRRRLHNARTELARAEEYDHVVINDDLETGLAALRAIVGPLFLRSEHAG